MPSAAPNVAVRATNQRLVAAVKVRKWLPPPILNSLQTIVVYLMSRNKTLRPRDYSNLSWFSLMRSIPNILNFRRWAGNSGEARRDLGFCKKVRGAFQVCLILFIYGASGGCKAFENEIDVSREDVNGSTVVLHTPSHEQVSNLDEAINSIKNDAEARKAAASYKINLHTRAITLDEPIPIKGLRLPPGSRIVISGPPNVGTTISGGFRAEKFLKPASSIDGEFRYTLMLSDLPAEKRKALIRKFASSSPNQVIIRAHGSMIIRPTRWPANEYVRVLDVSINQKGDLASFSFGTAVPEITDSVPGLWVGGYFTDSYFFVNARAEATDSSGRVWINRTHVRADGGPPERVYLYNLKSFTRCDSFFYDPQTQSLSFCTKQPIEKLEIAAIETLLDVSDSQDLAFENIIFEMSGGTAITVRDASNINLQNVVVQLTGNDGIVYSNVWNSTLSKITVRHVGGRAVWLAGGDRIPLIASGLVLEDSLLRDFSQINRTFAPAIQVDGVAVAIRRNIVFNGPQFAVMYSGNDHLFEENIFAQLVMEAGDSGFFYTGRDFTSQGNVIRRNVLLGTGNRYFSEARGVYLDEFSSGNTVAENIIVGIPYGVLINGGKDNKIFSNTFVLSTPSIWVSALGYASWWQIWRDSHMRVPDGLTVKNLYSLPVRTEPWASHYPRLRTYPDSDLLRPERNQIEQNTFLGGGSITTLDEKFETASSSHNNAIVYTGSLQLLEHFRYLIQLSDLKNALMLVENELDRHGISHMPLQVSSQVGAKL